jgi:biopolymer transport protein ExbB/TolQ
METKDFVLSFIIVILLGFSIFSISSLCIDKIEISHLKIQNYELKQKLNTQETFNKELLKHKFGLKFQTKGKMNDNDYTTRSNKGGG